MYIVYISSLHNVSSGTHIKNESFIHKDSLAFPFSLSCIFLYIIDTPVFLLKGRATSMYNKCIFYTFVIFKNLKFNPLQVRIPL